jgi:hypothetical protein
MSFFVLPSDDTAEVKEDAKGDPPALSLRLESHLDLYYSKKPLQMKRDTQRERERERERERGN